MDALKRMFQSCFTRGKKDKQEQGYAPPPPPPQSHVVMPHALDTRPPQLPPVQNASPLQTPGTMVAGFKSLPPTHPLSTGQSSQPQEAVPQDHDARPGPPSPIIISDPQETEKKLARPEEMSPLDLQAEGQDAEVDTPAVDEPSTVPHVQAEQVQDDAAATAPSSGLEKTTKTDSGLGEVQQNTSSKENEPPNPNATTAASEEQTQVAHEEPPPLKAIQLAPGMSATSGPLEDFPEGGEISQDEEGSHPPGDTFVLNENS